MGLTHQREHVEDLARVHNTYCVRGHDTGDTGLDDPRNDPERSAAIGQVETIRMAKIQRDMFLVPGLDHPPARGLGPGIDVAPGPYEDL
ncbi:MAG TPA: hypothetical protein VNA27_17535 [Rubrobacteraceae bacterium]|nr:hypothetical protein [Rubrobacteraceae bacterium]